jgi:hypothetical protein
VTADSIRLILRLIRGDAGAVDRLGASAGLPARLVEDAVAGGLGVALLRALDSFPRRFEVSARHLEVLQSRQQSYAKRSAVVLDAMAHVADRFTASGQVFILLKGPYLAERFFGDIHGREFVDLDLLVPSANRRHAMELLEGAGYTLRSRVIGGRALTGFFVHGFDFAAGRSYLDLHWQLSRHPSLRVDEARIWAERRVYSLGGRDFSVLSDEHELVFQALSLLRDIERGRPRGKTVIDIVQIAASLDAAMDWDAMLERARGEGTLGPLVNVLSLCLDAADAHDLAPRLSARLRAHARRVRRTASADPLEFQPVLWTLGNKWWTARSYDTSPAAWLFWWAASLPFRMATHRRPRLSTRPASR